MSGQMSTSPPFAVPYRAGLRPGPAPTSQDAATFLTGKPSRRRCRPRPRRAGAHRWRDLLGSPVSQPSSSIARPDRKMPASPPDEHGVGGDLAWCSFCTIWGGGEELGRRENGANRGSEWCRIVRKGSKKGHGWGRKGRMGAGKCTSGQAPFAFASLTLVRDRQNGGARMRRRRAGVRLEAAG